MVPVPQTYWMGLLIKPWKWALSLSLQWHIWSLRPPWKLVLQVWFGVIVSRFSTVLGYPRVSSDGRLSEEDLNIRVMKIGLVLGDALM